MTFLWSCFLLFGKVIIGSLLWLIALCFVCGIIGTIIWSIKEIIDKNKKNKKDKPEPPKGVESEGVDFTIH